MNRVQFIELHEQPWFPRFLRNDITDTLQYGLNASKAYASIAPLLQCALDSAGNPSIIDLCSGGGGPRDFHVSFTDKYPNYGAFANAKIRPRFPLRFCTEPVDARDVPVELDGFRTMFTSFHHFPIDEARSILKNAVNARQGIGILTAFLVRPL